MKKKINVQTGDLIKIPFKEKMHTYARVLRDNSYAFYDCPSTTDRNEFDVIIKSDILFVAHVDVFAIQEGFWTVITNIPLEENLKHFYPRYFNPNPANPSNKGFYEVYKDEIENAIKKDWIKTGKLQLAGMHGNVHVESRIRDYYDGKINNDNKATIEIFKKLSGLMS